MASTVRGIRAKAQGVGIGGRCLLSINDLTDDQVHAVFELARALEPWSRSRLAVLSGDVLCTLFFQPSTRTRMSFETAMLRLSGAVVSEATPLLSSSAAKEESLADMLTVVSRYANVIVLRHPDDGEARDAITHATVPVISGGLGHWEHPTQALMDLYTLWRVRGHIEGLTVCIASPDLVAARTGHSMAYGLARLGAHVVFASPAANRTPAEVRERLTEMGASFEEVFDLDQDAFNELAASTDLVYLPGCSAPKGPDAELFKQVMARYYLRLDTLQRVQRDQGRTVRVMHTLPRRPGEMDTRLDRSVHQLYFEAIEYSISLRMALLAAVLAT